MYIYMRCLRRLEEFFNGAREIGQAALSSAWLPRITARHLALISVTLSAIFHSLGNCLELGTGPSVFCNANSVKIGVSIPSLPLRNPVRGCTRQEISSIFQAFTSKWAISHATCLIFRGPAGPFKPHDPSPRVRRLTDSSFLKSAPHSLLQAYLGKVSRFSADVAHAWCGDFVISGLGGSFSLFFSSIGTSYIVQGNAIDNISRF